MVRSLSSLWLRSVRRAGKIQRAQSRVLKSLMPKAPKRKPAKAISIARKRNKPVMAKKVVPRAATRLPAPVAGAPASEGSWQKSWFSAVVPAGGAARRLLYWLYLPPPSLKAEAPLPLVVMLHGCQQTATDFATATRMNQLAERKGFAVLYPQQSASANAHRCWHWYQRASQNGQGDVPWLAALIGQVQQRHPIDTSRTYVAGLSAGAGMAAILALRHPELVAAVGLHSAPVFGVADSALTAYRTMQSGAARSYRQAAAVFTGGAPQFPGMPAIILQGDRDAVVRRINAQQLTQQFALINSDQLTGAEPVRRSYAGRIGGRSPRHAYTTLSYSAGRKPQLVQCDIAGLGHAWSGGDESVRFSSRAGPSAALMMWTFFARHRRLFIAS